SVVAVSLKKKPRAGAGDGSRDHEAILTLPTSAPHRGDVRRRGSFPIPPHVICWRVARRAVVLHPGQGAMPDPLRDQLQTSLGTAYTLGRELSAGGMSRVFVAREEALGRDVVVKVLAPELAAGLSAERFAREIKVAA